MEPEGLCQQGYADGEHEAQNKESRSAVRCGRNISADVMNIS